MSIGNEYENDVVKTTYLFPIDAKSMIEGEKNKVIKIFLNQLDLEIRDEEVKTRLRQVFLDTLNGFSRFSKGILKHYAENAATFERLIQEVRK